MTSSDKVFATSRRAILSALATLPALFAAPALAQIAATDPLPSWNDTATKKAIVTFVERVIKGALAGGEAAIFEIVTVTHSGMTTDEFEKVMRDWIATAKHPVTGRLYSEMVYQPMLELLAYLRGNGFKTFIVSGGGIDFMRVFAERVYGVPPDQVVGSSGKLNFELRDGRPILMKMPELNFNDDKTGKPVGIQMHIGWQPIAAFGNFDGDLQMLEWAEGGGGVRFALLVHHTDAEREWAYDRKSSIGHLDTALDAAQTEGWTVVDMENDWKTIFPFGSK
jgi:phosphoglycolate phosphatase-like HAD superfamily hydrolase